MEHNYRRAECCEYCKHKTYLPNFRTVGECLNQPTSIGLFGRCDLFEFADSDVLVNERG